MAFPLGFEASGGGISEIMWEVTKGSTAEFKGDQMAAEAERFGAVAMVR